MAESNPRLYGINASDRKNTEFWSKNRFNSSFPIALCCWLRDQGLPLLSLRARQDGTIAVADTSAAEVFGVADGCEPYFAFECAFEPYAKLCLGQKPPTCDVVIFSTDKELKPVLPVRGLEVKLTVVPDSTSGRLAPEFWGPELVFRPPTVRNAVLGLYLSGIAKKTGIRDLLREAFSRFAQWSSPAEAKQNLPHVLRALQSLVPYLEAEQRPLILQPIWRTKGQHLIADDAFDVYAWTDLAFLQLVIDCAAERKPAAKGGSASLSTAAAAVKSIRRQQRTATQMLRMLYQLATSDEVKSDQLFNEMGYGLQTDKALAISGRRLNPYLRHPRLLKPAIPLTALKDLILGGGHLRLSPERRLDSSIYFTWAEMFGEEPPPASSADAEEG